MEKSGSELALQSTLRKNFENFRLLKVVEWGGIIEKNDPQAILTPKKHERKNLGSHIVAPESTKVPKLGPFFSK